MPRYEVTLERDYINRERVTIEVEADDEATARKEAQQMGEDDDFTDGEDWYEVDGGPGDVDVIGCKVIDETKADEIVDE